MVWTSSGSLPERLLLPFAARYHRMDRARLMEPAALVDIRLENDPQHSLLRPSRIGNGRPRAPDRRDMAASCARHLPRAGRRGRRVGRVSRDQRQRAVVDCRTRRANPVWRGAGEASPDIAAEAGAAGKSRQPGDAQNTGHPVPALNPPDHDCPPFSQFSRKARGLYPSRTAPSPRTITGVPERPCRCAKASLASRPDVSQAAPALTSSPA